MKKLLELLPILILLGGFYFLRPTFWGGHVTYVMVSGQSMEPTMYAGDLALAWRQDNYKTGDVVAFQVAVGERSGMVIHRVIGGNGEDGYRVQGDNNDYVDGWRPTGEQVQGKALVFIPRLGAVFGYLQGDSLRLAVVMGVFFGYISLVSAFLANSVGGSRARRRVLRDRALQRRRPTPWGAWPS